MFKTRLTDTVKLTNGKRFFTLEKEHLLCEDSPQKVFKIVRSTSAQIFNSMYKKFTYTKPWCSCF